MVNYKVVFTKQVQKDAKKLSASGLKAKAEQVIEILPDNSYQTPPFYEKLVGNIVGAYSRRINIQHRLIYEVIENEKIVKVIRMWTHYE